MPPIHDNYQLLQRKGNKQPKKELKKTQIQGNRENSENRLMNCTEDREATNNKQNKAVLSQERYV